MHQPEDFVREHKAEVPMVRTPCLRWWPHHLLPIRVRNWFFLHFFLFFCKNKKKVLYNIRSHSKRAIGVSANL